MSRRPLPVKGTKSVGLPNLGGLSLNKTSRRGVPPTQDIAAEKRKADEALTEENTRPELGVNDILDLVFKDEDFTRGVVEQYDAFKKLFPLETRSDVENNAGYSYSRHRESGGMDVNSTDSSDVKQFKIRKLIFNTSAIGTMRCQALYPEADNKYVVTFSSVAKMNETGTKCMEAFTTNVVTMQMSFAQCASQMPTLPDGWDKEVSDQPEMAKNDAQTCEVVKKYRDESDKVYKNIASTMKPGDSEYYTTLRKKCTFYNDRLLLVSDWSSIVSDERNNARKILNAMMEHEKVSKEHMRAFAQHFDILRKVVESTMIVKYGSIAFPAIKVYCSVENLDVDQKLLGEAIVDAMTPRIDEDTESQTSQRMRLTKHYMKRMSNIMMATYDSSTKTVTGSDMHTYFTNTPVPFQSPDELDPFEESLSIFDDDLKPLEDAIDLWIHLAFRHPENATSSGVVINLDQPAWYGKSCVNASTFISCMKRPAYSMSLPDIIALQRSIQMTEEQTKSGSTSGEGPSGSTQGDPSASPMEKIKEGAELQVALTAQALEQPDAKIEDLTVTMSAEKQEMTLGSANASGKGIVQKGISDAHPAKAVCGPKELTMATMTVNTQFEEKQGTALETIDSIEADKRASVAACAKTITETAAAIVNLDKNNTVEEKEVFTQIKASEVESLNNLRDAFDIQAPPVALPNTSEGSSSAASSSTTSGDDTVLFGDKSTTTPTLSNIDPADPTGVRLNIQLKFDAQMIQNIENQHEAEMKSLNEKYNQLVEDKKELDDALEASAAAVEEQVGYLQKISDLEKTVGELNEQNQRIRLSNEEAVKTLEGEKEKLESEKQRLEELQALTDEEDATESETLRVDIAKLEARIKVLAVQTLKYVFTAGKYKTFYESEKTAAERLREEAATMRGQIEAAEQQIDAQYAEIDRLSDAQLQRLNELEKKLEQDWEKHRDKQDALEYKQDRERKIKKSREKLDQVLKKRKADREDWKAQVELFNKTWKLNDESIRKFNDQTLKQYQSLREENRRDAQEQGKFQQQQLDNHKTWWKLCNDAMVKATKDYNDTFFKSSKIAIDQQAAERKNANEIARIQNNFFFQQSAEIRSNWIATNKETRDQEKAARDKAFQDDKLKFAKNKESRENTMSEVKQDIEKLKKSILESKEKQAGEFEKQKLRKLTAEAQSKENANAKEAEQLKAIKLDNAIKRQKLKIESEKFKKQQADTRKALAQAESAELSLELEKKSQEERLERMKNPDKNKMDMHKMTINFRQAEGEANRALRADIAATNNDVKLQMNESKQAHDLQKMQMAKKEIRELEGTAAPFATFMNSVFGDAQAPIQIQARNTIGWGTVEQMTYKAVKMFTLTPVQMVASFCLQMVGFPKFAEMFGPGAGPDILGMAGFGTLFSRTGRKLLFSFVGLTCEFALEGLGFGLTFVMRQASGLVLGLGSLLWGFLGNVTTWVVNAVYEFMPANPVEVLELAKGQLRERGSLSVHVAMKISGILLYFLIGAVLVYLAKKRPDLLKPLLQWLSNRLTNVASAVANAVRSVRRKLSSKDESKDGLAQMQIDSNKRGKSDDTSDLEQGGASSKSARKSTPSDAQNRAELGIATNFDDDYTSLEALVESTGTTAMSTEIMDALIEALNADPSLSKID